MLATTYRLRRLFIALGAMDITRSVARIPLQRLRPVQCRRDGGQYVNRAISGIGDRVFVCVRALK